MEKRFRAAILVFSLVFFAFLMLLVYADKIRGMDGVTLGVLSCLTLLLGGPVAYFFVHAASTRFDLTMPWGRVTLVGCYAVAATATFLIWMAPEREFLRKISLDNVRRDIRASDIQVEQISEGGQLRILRSDSDNGPFEFVCYYPSSLVGEIEVRITYVANILEGQKEITKSVPRVGAAVAQVPME